MSSPDIKQVWLADDASGAGKLHTLYKWYNEVKDTGHKYGYYVNERKSWLIVKDPAKADEAKQIFGDYINITTEGKRHLGAALGSQIFKEQYCKDMVENWLQELNQLCEFAKTEPHAAYAAYCHGYKGKFTYFMRTIEGLECFLQPIEDLLTTKLIPVLFGDITISQKERLLYSLPTREGGLGIGIMEEESLMQYKASKLFTAHLVSLIVMQELQSEKDDNKKIQREYHKLKKEQIDEKTRSVYYEMDTDMKRAISHARDKGSSHWLSALPLVDQGFKLNKGEFRDALRLRYNKQLKGLPSKCPFGSKFDVCHALSCGRGGFVIMRHDEIRDITASMLNEICKDVEIEPRLQPITGEQMRYRTATSGDEARLDIKARGFSRRNQAAFFDINVTHVNAASYRNLSQEQILKNQENKKKRKYNQRVMEVEGGSFTPLVFGTNGAIGKECNTFISNLATKLSAK